MSRTIVIRPQAEVEIDAIAWELTVHGSTELGLRFYVAAGDAFEQLAAMPEMGAARDYVAAQVQGVRMWRVQGFPKYLIFYRPLESGIEVLRVLHGARDLEAIFGE